MYNVLLYKYQNSYQIRSYQFGIRENQKKSEGSSFDDIEDEIDKAFSETDDKYHFEGHSAYVSINRSKNKIFYYSRSNDWSNGYFVTLTFDQKRYDAYDFSVCSKLIRKFTRLLREYDSNCYGLFVPELHPSSGRYHFHGLIGGIDLEKEGFIVDSGHKINGDKIYNFVKGWKNGFSTVSKIKSSLAVEKYIAKYTTKDLLNNTKYQHRYFTFNLHESEIVKYNIPKDDEFIQELYKTGKVLFGNTDGLYNRVTYLEVEKSDEIENLIRSYVVPS